MRNFPRMPVTDEETKAEALLAHDSAKRDMGSGTLVSEIVFYAKLLASVPGRIARGVSRLVRRAERP